MEGLLRPLDAACSWPRASHPSEPAGERAGAGCSWRLLSDRFRVFDFEFRAPPSAAGRSARISVPLIARPPPPLRPTRRENTEHRTLNTDARSHTTQSTHGDTIIHLSEYVDASASCRALAERPCAPCGCKSHRPYRAWYAITATVSKPPLSGTPGVLRVRSPGAGRRHSGRYCGALGAAAERAPPLRGAARQRGA